jgi:hypothetical protein
MMTEFASPNGFTDQIDVIEAADYYLQRYLNDFIDALIKLDVVAI